MSVARTHAYSAGTNTVDRRSIGDRNGWGSRIYLAGWWWRQCGISIDPWTALCDYRLWLPLLFCRRQKSRSHLIKKRLIAVITATKRFACFVSGPLAGGERVGESQDVRVFARLSLPSRLEA